MKVYYVYILASTTKTLYIGVTNSIERRVAEHKSGIVDGFAKKYGCKQLVYLESCSNIKDALAREKQLKKWNRAKKEWLIATQNPHWRDLSISS